MDFSETSECLKAQNATSEKAFFKSFLETTSTSTPDICRVANFRPLTQLDGHCSNIYAIVRQSLVSSN